MSVYEYVDNNTNKLSVHAINGISGDLGALVIKKGPFEYNSTTHF